jgi:serine/threonine-protein kinase
MSPEQATGDRVDGRSDLYSLGLTAYFALTGRVAMAADSTGKALVKQITETLPPMSTVRPELPAALAESIDRCLMKEPDTRFARAEELVEALDAAQLTGPEIPTAIRLFAQEAGTLSLILVLGSVLAYFVGRSIKAEGSADVLVPIVMFAAVLITRTAQTFGEARRLAVSGFSPDAVHRGLLAVLAERAARRAELGADPGARRMRRRTLGFLAFSPFVIVAMMWLAFLRRKQIGPHQFQLGLVGAVFLFGAIVLFGVSLGMLLRSPFRPSIGERLFRVIWLGPIGRAFVRFAGRGLTRDGASASSAQRSGASRVRAAPPAAPAPRSTQGAVAASDRIGALEVRVAELERWRREN